MAHFLNLEVVQCIDACHHVALGIVGEPYPTWIIVGDGLCQYCLTFFLFVEEPLSGNITKQYLYLLTQPCLSILLNNCFLLLRHRCPAILLHSCRNLLSQSCLTIGTMFCNIETKLFNKIQYFSLHSIFFLQLCINVASIFFCQCCHVAKKLQM